jgi:LSD1 subclass zinc finger protein
MPDFTEKTESINLQLSCKDCGALLKFKPGTTHLTCEYCGAQNVIGNPDGKTVIKENSLEDILSKNMEREEQMEVTSVKCDGCHAINTFEPKTVSDKCAFCGSPLVVQGGSRSTMHKPQYVLPFGIETQAATDIFKKWLSSLWFAPSKLIHYADTSKGLNGVYLPFWTFDCKTSTNYSGQRGEHYIVTENYTANENGQQVTRQRNVTKTRWHSASGRVSNTFDDILIPATKSLDKTKLQSLEPWDLKNLKDYNDHYLSGFRTESFGIDVRTSYGEAKLRMDPIIENTIKDDIGGDEQRVNSKSISLPVWVSAFRYNDKVYQFIINARTGELQGERPYSTIKIVLAILGGAIALFALFGILGQ